MLTAFIRANPAPSPNPGRKKKTMARAKARRNAGVTKRESRKVSAWARALKAAGGNSKKASRIYRGKTTSTRKAAKRAGKVKRSMRSWKACMKTAGGNARLASKLYRSGRGCSTMKRVGAKTRRGLKARAKVRRSTKSYGRHTWSECLRAAGGDAKLASRFYRQKRVACSKLRKVSTRTRTAKAKRAKHRRSVEVKTFAPGVFAEANPRRTSKKKKTRRSAKKMPKRNKKGRFVKSGGKRRKSRKSASRRKSARRAPARRKSARRKSSRRRGVTVTVRSNPCPMSNPSSLKGAFTSIKKTLTSKRYLAQLGTGAVSAAANAYLGAMAAGWIQQRVDFFAGEGWAATALRAVTSVTTGTLSSLIIPKGYRNAWLFGAGVAAFLPLVQKAMDAIPGLSGAGVSGLGDYLTVADCRRIAAQSSLGMGDYFTVRDARRVALRAA